jgi:excisionase family DNA binding protein
MKQAEPIKRRLLNIQEVAEYTGLSVHTLYTMVSQRRIPFVKAGRLTKFDVQLLDAWIEKHTVMPLNKPERGESAKPEMTLDKCSLK